MSYKQFVTDLNEFYKDDSHKGIHYELGQTIVRDNWIKNGRYDELIDFILENWDSGNCDDFIQPLEEKLIAESHIKRFTRLWRRIIYFRLVKFLDTLKDFKKVDITAIDKIDVSNFNMLSVDSYKDSKKVLAFRRDFLLKGITKFRKGLKSLGDDMTLTELDELEYGTTNFDKTKLVLKNWR